MSKIIERFIFIERAIHWTITVQLINILFNSITVDTLYLWIFYKFHITFKIEENLFDQARGCYGGSFFFVCSLSETVFRCEVTQKSQNPAIFDQPFSNSIILQDKGNHNHEGSLETWSIIDFDDFVSVYSVVLVLIEQIYQTLFIGYPNPSSFIKNTLLCAIIFKALLGVWISH